MREVINMHFGHLKSATAVAALSIFLAGCGGSEPASSNESSAPVVEADAVAPEVVEDTTVETAAAEVEEAAEEVVAEVEDAAAAVVEEVEAVEDAAAEMAEDAAEAVEETVEAATSAADDRVSAETVAAYAALTGDAAKGRRVFTQCMSCHAVQEGRNMAGPSLYGIVGRTSGSVEGFRYSDANANSGIVWTEPTMFAYLERPQQFIPGTIMAFPGLPREQDRADVIAYLKEQSQ